MSEARSLLSPGLTLIVGVVVGGLAGVYGTRLIEGDAPHAVDPSPTPVRECPPCERCPVCPPAPECGEVSLIPSQDAPPPAEPSDDLERDFDLPPEAPAGPGLSARAIAQASAAVRVAIEPCLAQDGVDAASGMLLLDLTVTATGAVGFVTDALITQRSGDTEAVEACVQQAAGRARFEYEGPDGAQRVKLPIKIGNY